MLLIVRCVSSQAKSRVDVVDERRKVRERQRIYDN
jgi:hypothetical protein